nr:unnamed protein product [Digitaria exilis]
MAWASQLPPGYSIEIVRSSVTADFIVTILWIPLVELDSTVESALGNIFVY